MIRIRPSAARNMVRWRISRTAAMAMAGWKTDAIYRRYRILSHKDLREATAKLEGPRFAPALPPETLQAALALPYLAYLWMT